MEDNTISNKYLSWKISKKTKSAIFFKIIVFFFLPFYLLFIPYIVFSPPRHNFNQTIIKPDFKEFLNIYIIGFFIFLAIFLFFLALIYLFSSEESYILNKEGITKTTNKKSKKYLWSDLIKFYIYEDFFNSIKNTKVVLSNNDLINQSIFSINKVKHVEDRVIYLQIKKPMTLSKISKRFLKIKVLPENFNQTIIFLNQKLSSEKWNFKSKGIINHYE